MTDCLASTGVISLMPNPSFDLITHNGAVCVQRFSHAAMATIFELMLIHDNPEYAAQAAFAAFNEADRLEQNFSRFIENSDISRINHLERLESTIIGVDSFRCLQIAGQINQKTNGSFDPNIGKLVNHWKKSRLKEVGIVVQQQVVSGKRFDEILRLNEDDYSVQLLENELQLDLGGIGKGYALDIMAEFLKEWEIEAALLHSGRSTALAYGRYDWPITISNPQDSAQILFNYKLENAALSGSGLEKGCHIIDPRTGNPAQHHSAAWSIATTGAEADALSTAFMVMTGQEIEKYCSSHDQAGGIVLTNEDTLSSLIKFGDWPSLTIAVDY